ncbi:MAG: hypothetical protein ACRDJE_26475, partial [Dehalococcoidia bacterium]
MADARIRGATDGLLPRFTPGALITRRWSERLLLLPVAVVLVIGAAALERSESGAPPDLWRSVLIFCVAFAVAEVAVSLLTPNADKLLLPLVAMLSAVGLLFVARLEPDFSTRQAIWYALGVGALIAVLLLLPDPRVLRSYKYLAASLGLGLMITTAIFGKEINGSR